MKKTILIQHTALFILLFPFCFMAQGQNYNALSWHNSKAYYNFLMYDVHQQYEDRKVEFENALKSREAMIQYRDDCIKRYKEIVGDFPKKGDLNPKVIGTSQQDGFRVERIIFESLPKRYVTADLFIPNGKGPFPAAVQVCGHGLRGKIPASRPAVLFALNGIATIVVDPVGQGERIQFLDKDSHSLTRGATTGHTLLNQGANLLGSSVAAYEFWDNSRAIDYLQTRSDIDPNQIGVHGSSGGGTQTVYMLGLDERIKVAAIGVYFSKREQMFDLYGPADGCQHIPYEGREHLEIADFVLMMAPKPVFIMASRYDSNAEYWGVTKAFAELKDAYSVLGNPEKVDMFVVERGHEIPKPTREKLVTWFRRWLVDDPTPVHEVKQVSIPVEDLQCTSTGQVNTAIPDAISFPDYNLALSEKYAQQRSDFVNEGKAKVTQKVMELLGISMPIVKIQPEETGSLKMRNFDLKKYQIIRVGQMALPCVVIVPENVKPGSRVVLYLNERGKNEVLSDDQTVGSYVNQNDILVVADLRGFGETEDPLSLNDTKFWNREYRTAMVSMHIGKPIMGQRVIDIMSLLDFIDSDQLLKDREVDVVANGAYGPAVVHAAFLDSRIGKAEISRSIKSFNDYLKNPLQYDIYSNVLYGVLKYYDLKDLVDLSGEGRVRFVD